LLSLASQDQSRIAAARLVSHRDEFFYFGLLFEMPPQLPLSRRVAMSELTYA
jgi:hypothetical protein